MSHRKETIGQGKKNVGYTVLYWHGTMEELEKLDKEIKKACEETEGIEYEGRYGPHNKKYHWAHFFKIDSYDKWMAMGDTIPRDYNKMSHIVIDLFQ